MTPDQVDDAGWSSEEWSSLNELAARTVAENTKLRRVIPEAPEARNAYQVDMATAATRSGAGAKPAALQFDIAPSTRVVRAHVDFDIAANQTHDLENIRALVKRAARQLANVEDLTLAFGTAGATALLNQSAGVIDGTMDGLTTKAEDRDEHTAKAPEAPLPQHRTPIDTKLIHGVRALNVRGFGGAFHAVLGFEAYHVLLADVSSSRTGLERAKLVLGSHDAQIASAPPNSKALDYRVTVFVPDHAALDLVFSKTAHLAYVGIDNGDLRLRIEESFRLRIKDSSAIVLVS